MTDIDDINENILLYSDPNTMMALIKTYPDFEKFTKYQSFWKIKKEIDKLPNWVPNFLTIQEYANIYESVEITEDIIKDIRENPTTLIPMNTVKVHKPDDSGVFYFINTLDLTINDLRDLGFGGVVHDLLYMINHKNIIPKNIVSKIAFSYNGKEYRVTYTLLRYKNNSRSSLGTKTSNIISRKLLWEFLSKVIYEGIEVKRVQNYG